MSARQLPDRPHLRHLRNEAKALRRALKEGDAEALAAVRPHLGRLRGVSGDLTDGATVTLQEAQHALAREYGFGDWAALVEAVGPQSADVTIDSLTELSATDAATFVRTVDRRDLVWLLGDADEGLRAAIEAAASPRMARYLREEQAEETRPTPGEVQASRRRATTVLRELIADAAVTWPPGTMAAPTTAALAFPSDVRPLLAREIPTLSPEELIQILRSLTEFVTSHGWHAAENLASQAQEFLGEGVRLVIDGTEPDLVMDLLETRRMPLIQRRVMGLRMMVEAVFAVLSGDNPRIVAYKLETFYRDSMAHPDGMRLPDHVSAATLDSLREILHRGPFSQRTSDEQRDFFSGLAVVRRRDGLDPIPTLAPDAQDALLSVALGRIADVVLPPTPGCFSPDDWLEEIETQLTEIVEEEAHRYQMAVDGLRAAQLGVDADEVEKVMRGVRRRPYNQIQGTR